MALLRQTQQQYYSSKRSFTGDGTTNRFTLSTSFDTFRGFLPDDFTVYINGDLLERETVDAGGAITVNWEQGWTAGPPSRYFIDFIQGVTPADGDTISVEADPTIWQNALGINEERFRRCSGWLSKGNDCLSTKGFQHIQIRVDNQRLDIYNTHLDSGNRKSDYSVRETQIYHLLDYIRENSDGYPVILSGDLNINLLDDKEIYLINTLRDDLNLDMVDWVAKDSNYVEVLDYILYRGVNLVDGAFGVSRRLVGLSDHPPIEADFKLRK